MRAARQRESSLRPPAARPRRRDGRPRQVICSSNSTSAAGAVVQRADLDHGALIADEMRREQKGVALRSSQDLPGQDEDEPLLRQTRDSLGCSHRGECSPRLFAEQMEERRRPPIRSVVHGASGRSRRYRILRRDRRCHRRYRRVRGHGVRRERRARARGRDLDGIPILWIDEAAALAATHLAVCGLGTTQRSRFTEQAEAAGFRFATVVHPTAHVSGDVDARSGNDRRRGRDRRGAHDDRAPCDRQPRRAGRASHRRRRSRLAAIGGERRRPLRDRRGAPTSGWARSILNTISVGAHSVVGAGAVVTRDVPDTRAGRRHSGGDRQRGHRRQVSIEATPLIINAALTGMVPTKADNPALPSPPTRSPRTRRGACDAGASILHLHARDDAGPAHVSRGDLCEDHRRDS